MAVTVYTPENPLMGEEKRREAKGGGDIPFNVETLEPCPPSQNSVKIIFRWLFVKACPARPPFDLAVSLLSFSPLLPGGFVHVLRIR